MVRAIALYPLLFVQATQTPILKYQLNLVMVKRFLKLENAYLVKDRIRNAWIKSALFQISE